MNEIVLSHANGDDQPLSSTSISEIDIQKPQSQRQSSLVKFIDQPIASPKRHKIPFYSNLPEVFKRCCKGEFDQS